MRNLLTIDIEDYYMVSAFADRISFENWRNYDSRVEKNTYRMLDLLEENNVKATFFVLGWVAERSPQLIKEIHNRGHELACHSYNHRLVYNMTPSEFREDTGRAKEILEQISGAAVTGYRAPSYSITKASLWALDILAELGFEYDSSIFPILHDRYGVSDAPRFRYKIPDSEMVEYPISTSFFCGMKMPVSGGGYFRLFPYSFTKMLLNRINDKEKQPFVFYIHPWEIDPDQPRINNVGMISGLRHYNNLAKTQERFRRLLKDFSFAPIKDIKS